MSKNNNYPTAVHPQVSQTITFENLPNTVQQLVKEVQIIKTILLEGAETQVEDKLLSITETAELLHIQKQTIYGYVHKGIIPYSKRAGRLYFSKKDLIEWIKEGNQRPFDVEEEAKRIIETRKKKGGVK